MITLRAGAPTPDGTDIAHHVATRLAAFKVPARWFVAETSPRTPTGKVRKFALRDAIANGVLREI